MPSQVVVVPVVWEVTETGRGTLLATCEALGLTLEADSREELSRMIREGVVAFFSDLLADGDLELLLSSPGEELN